MERERIRIDAPDAASAAYLMSELVGRFEAELVAPSTGGRWTVLVGGDRHVHELLPAVIDVVARALRAHELAEATIRLGARSYTIRNQEIAPRRSAA